MRKRDMYLIATHTESGTLYLCDELDMDSSPSEAKLFFSRDDAHAHMQSIFNNAKDKLLRMKLSLLFCDHEIMPLRVAVRRRNDEILRRCEGGK